MDRMSGRLCHLALTVEQTGNRTFDWLLIESAAGRVLRGAIGRGELHDAL